jgi:uncharacterized membrane protein
MTRTNKRQGTRIAVLTSAVALLALMTFTASAQALTKFGSDLRNRTAR